MLTRGQTRLVSSCILCLSKEGWLGHQVSSLLTVTIKKTK